MLSAILAGFVCLGLQLHVVLSQGWIYDDEGCRTPDRGVGSCVPIKSCRPMLEFLERAPKPLPSHVKTALNDYTCGYAGEEVKVCCPNAPINVEEDPPEVREHRNFGLLPKECGLINTDNRIRNGENAQLNEFPWMALIAYRSAQGPSFRCGGSIISDSWVLTAAHCIKGTASPIIGVRVGEHDITTARDCERQPDGSTRCAPPYQDLSVEGVYPHPDFSTTTVANDIGLLKVSRIDVNGINIAPVCLPTGPTANAKFKHAVVTGWGFTETNRKANILQKVALPFVTLEECQRVYNDLPKSSVRITDRQLCAGGRDDKDSCAGDSGGPLQVSTFINDDTRYIQQGVVSFGHRYCGTAGYPGVYTRVAYYMNWILDTIGD